MTLAEGLREVTELLYQHTVKPFAISLFTASEAKDQAHRWGTDSFARGYDPKNDPYADLV